MTWPQLHRFLIHRKNMTTNLNITSPINNRCVLFLKNHIFDWTSFKHPKFHRIKTFGKCSVWINSSTVITIELDVTFNIGQVYVKNNILFLKFQDFSRKRYVFILFLLSIYFFYRRLYIFLKFQLWAVCEEFLHDPTTPRVHTTLHLINDQQRGVCRRPLPRCRLLDLTTWLSIKSTIKTHWVVWIEKLALDYSKKLSALC